LKYFSAKWCPHCREFTPILIKFLKKANPLINVQNNSHTSGVVVDIEWISGDKDEKSYDEYF